MNVSGNESNGSLTRERKRKRTIAEVDNHGRPPPSSSSSMGMAPKRRPKKRVKKEETYDEEDEEEVEHEEHEEESPTPGGGGGGASTSKSQVKSSTRKSSTKVKVVSSAKLLSATSGPTIVRLVVEDTNEEVDDEEIEEKSAPRDRYPDKSIPDLLGCAHGLRSFCLLYPESSEAFPWKHRVFKVSNKKIFCFLGGEPGVEVNICVKLSLDEAAAIKTKYPNHTSDPGYGMHKSGWIGIKVSEEGNAPGEPNLSELKNFIDTSYRNIAKKGLIKVISEQVNRMKSRP